MAGWRPVLVVAAGALLLAGCTSGSDDGAGAEGKPKRSSGSPTPATPSATPVSDPYTLPEESAPKTRAEAIAFVRELEVRPDFFGIGYRKREPFESDPTTWAVLHEDCQWRREGLPATVLASLTRAFELQEKNGKGSVYVSLTVTVHENAVAARRDMAGSLESALRCPEQRLNATDVVRGLYSRVDAFTDERNAVSDDDLAESGEWVADGVSEAHPFDWSKFRLGPVTVAATARHGAGRTEAEDSAVTGEMLQGVGYVAAEIDSQGDAGGAGAKDEPAETPADTPVDTPAATSAETEGAER
ncbi:hypothetical protein [Streptomyces sp. GESEQ-35]|uniref:hypothetical protein n=1 Tax=Streptomyces sp. GESEQ-35 TaxID=2812657 RepID=UPI001FF12A3A|nr:hypothetical protein [Streptomyces sp. GESEQ-35]